MAKRPEDRYSSVKELKSDLELILSHPTERVPKPRHRRSPGTRGSLWKVMVGLVLAAFALPIAFWVGRSMIPLKLKHRGAPTANVTNASIPPFRGVTADTIHLGTSTAFNGPNEELGRNMVVGMRTYFSRVNETGGVHGRQIKMTVLDDRYDPDRALRNMTDLLEVRNAFAVIGNVGTPTAKVTSQYASQNRLLFFGAYTGAGLLRDDPPDRYIFNYRASYQDETSAIVQYFVESLGVSAQHIAIFAQNDAYGDDGFAGVARAIRAYGIEAEQLVRVGYNRNQLEIADALSTILNGDFQAIVMVPTYKVAARFIKRVRQIKPEMIFGAVSFVGSRALAEEFCEIGPEYGDGVIVTQVVPMYTSNATGVLQYRELLRKYYPEYEPGFISLEGFITAAVFVEGLRRAGPVLTTETLIDALHEIRGFDLGIGPIIEFSPSRHQASHRVWGTRLNAKGEFEQLDLGR